MSSYNSLCIGIDLGTTNSLIASCRTENGKINTPVKMVSRIVDTRGTKRNDSLLPSCVYYQVDENGNSQEPIVGDFAKSMHAAMPFRVSKSVKSQMGQERLVGLDSNIVDSKPEEVSARIIKHLISDMENYYGDDEEITDVVITVPASFDSAQRLATLRAAELAGVDVKTDDGNYDQGILLSEPEAVMYYLLNQIKKGECDIRLDFSEKKNILIFDIGGGTLDITLHSVSQNEENPDILNIDLIATNRFTPVAGDTFDKLVAQEMYERYLSYYQQVMPSIVPQIEKDKDKMLAALEAHAEDLKLKINVRYDDAVYRHRTLADTAEFDCGGRMPNEYPYDDFFTKEEYESCVEPLLGNSYRLNDYKDFEGKEQTNDIIWPILDVLRKAMKKEGGANVKLDAVLISGGMSRLYLVKNRLEEFFGTHIISVPDPDTAVAQGAVVYHYHQHQNSEIMKKLHEKLGDIVEPIEPENSFLKIGKKVLADPVYLGLKGGEVMLLADEGQDLPFSSNKISGLKIDAGQTKICVPIQRKGFGSSYITMASGNILFKEKYDTEMPVSIRFDINEDQIITIEAWTSRDNEGQMVMEKGKVSFSFGEDSKEVSANNVQAQADNNMAQITKPDGPKADVQLMMANLKNACMLKKPATQVRGIKSKIYQASNPEDFAEILINNLYVRTNNIYYYLSLIVIARRLSIYWNDNNKKRLKNVCFDLLNGNIQNLRDEKAQKLWYSALGEAVTIIGMHGSSDELESLCRLKWMSINSMNLSYINALAMNGYRLDWIYDIMRKSKKQRNMAIRAIGMAIYKAKNIPASVDIHDIVKTAESLLVQDNMSLIFAAITTLGYILGSSQAKAILGNGLVISIKAEIMSKKESGRYDKAVNLAIRLMEGQQLSVIEEQNLLGLLDDF